MKNIPDISWHLAKIADHEAELFRINLELLSMLELDSRTIEECEELLDSLPCGYVSFCVRRKIHSLENQE